jgi:hypothetical protein
MVKKFVILTVENTNTRYTSSNKPYFLIRHERSEVYLSFLSVEQRYRR